MATASYMQGRKKYRLPQGMLWADNPGTILDNGFVPLGNEVNGDGTINENGSFLILSDDNRSPFQFSQERIEKRQRLANGVMRSYHIADKVKIQLSWSMLPSRSFSSSPDFAQDGTTSLITSGYRTGTQKEVSHMEAVRAPNTELFFPQHEVDPDLNPETDNNVLVPAKTVILQGDIIGANKVIDTPDPDGVSITHNTQKYTSDGGAGGVELLDWYENNPGSFWVYLAYDKYDNYGNASTAYDNVGKYSQIIEMFFADFSYTVVKRGVYDFWDVNVTLEEV